MQDNVQKMLIAEKKPLQFEPSEVQAAATALEKYITLMQNNNRLLESGINAELIGEYNDVSLKRFPTGLFYQYCVNRIVFFRGKVR